MGNAFLLFPQNEIEFFIRQIKMKPFLLDLFKPKRNVSLCQNYLKHSILKWIFKKSTSISLLAYYLIETSFSHMLLFSTQD